MLVSIYTAQQLTKLVDDLHSVIIRRVLESMMGLRQRQGNLRLVFRLFSLMRGLPSIRLKKSENEPEIFLLRPQPFHRLYFSPIIFSKTEYPLNS